MIVKQIFLPFIDKNIKNNPNSKIVENSTLLVTFLIFTFSEFCLLQADYLFEQYGIQVDFGVDNSLFKNASEEKNLKLFEKLTLVLVGEEAIKDYYSSCIFKRSCLSFSCLPIAVVLLSAITLNVPLCAADLLRFKVKGRFHNIAMDEVNKNEQLANLKLYFYLPLAKYILKCVYLVNNVIAQLPAKASYEILDAKNFRVYLKSLLYRGIIKALLPEEVYCVAVVLLNLCLDVENFVPSSVIRKSVFESFTLLSGIIVCTCRIVFCQMRHVSKCEWGDTKSNFTLWPDFLTNLVLKFEDPYIDLDLQSIANVFSTESIDAPKLLHSKQETQENLSKQILNNKNMFMKLPVKTDLSELAQFEIVRQSVDCYINGFLLGKVCLAEDHNLFLENDEEQNFRHLYQQIPLGISEVSLNSSILTKKIHPSLRLVIRRLSLFFNVPELSIIQCCRIIEKNFTV